jgi:hypothetical protein
MLVMSVDVTTTPTFTVGTPKLLFRLPGPLGGNLGNISRDGQRFVFAVNVSAAAPTLADPILTRAGSRLASRVLSRLRQRQRPGAATRASPRTGCAR